MYKKVGQRKTQTHIPEADCMEKYIQGPYFYADFFKKIKQEIEIDIEQK